MAAKQQVRLAFRRAVFKRDCYRCAMCRKAGKDRQGGNDHIDDAQVKYVSLHQFSIMKSIPCNRL
jgi:hypothetical protein